MNDSNRISIIENSPPQGPTLVKDASLSSLKKSLNKTSSVFLPVGKAIKK